MRGRSGERGSGISVLAARHDDDDDLKKSNKFLNLDLEIWLDCKIPFQTKGDDLYNSGVCFFYINYKKRVQGFNKSSVLLLHTHDMDM